MKQIETESIAQLFLSWLRQSKPTVVTDSRDITVNDFGKLLLLSGAAPVILTAGVLTRSGSLKVALLNNEVESGVSVPGGSIDLENGGTPFSQPILFSSAETENETSSPKIINLYYNHSLNTWYVNIEGKALHNAGSKDDSSGDTSDRYTLVRRDSTGGIQANNALILFDTDKDIDGAASDNTLALVNDGAKSGEGYTFLQSTINGNAFVLDLYHTGNTTMTFSSRAKAAGSYVIVDAPDTKYANDAAAALGGVAIGEVYETTANKFRARMA